jgi:hypothetical protein
MNSRSLIGRIGAYAQHARHDPRLTTAHARASAETALNQRLLADIDPLGQLSEADRTRRLEYARKEYFARLALKAAQARQKKVLAK